MDLLSTSEIAEHMLTSEKSYSMSSLYKELGLPSDYVAGKFHNIRMAKKYKTVVVATDPITIKVVDINGKSKDKSLWQQVLQSNF